MTPQTFLRGDGGSIVAFTDESYNADLQLYGFTRDREHSFNTQRNTHTHSSVHHDTRSTYTGPFGSGGCKITGYDGTTILMECGTLYPFDDLGSMQCAPTFTVEATVETFSVGRVAVGEVAVAVSGGEHAYIISPALLLAALW